jgi:hypothetical protein
MAFSVQTHRPRGDTVLLRCCSPLGVGKPLRIRLPPKASGQGKRPRQAAKVNLEDNLARGLISH